MKATLAAVLIAAAAGSANSQALPDVLRAYKEASVREAWLCTMSYDTYVINVLTERGLARYGAASAPQGLEEAQKCVKDAKFTIMSYFQSSKLLPLSAGAASALREHMVAVNTQLEGLAPAEGESRSVYERRRAAEAARAKEAWFRVELELR